MRPWIVLVLLGSAASLGLGFLSPAHLIGAPPTTQGESRLNTLADVEKAAGWKLLFDGKTTTGWRGYKQDHVPAGWKVIDGTLDRVERCGDLITIDSYASFELVLDWRISPGGNSGVMYHVTEEYDEPGKSGPECQILDNVRNSDPNLAGWCYGLYRPAIDPATRKPLDTTLPAGQWNHTRILVEGAHVEHWMNGVKYVEYELWSADWKQRVASSKFSAWPAFALAKSGYLCLQDHGDEVAFRNIKLRVINRESDK